MTLTVTLSHPRYVDGFVETANRFGRTPEDVALELLTYHGKTYADLYKVGVITSAAFVARFTPEEYASIIAAATQDEGVKALLDTLLAEPIVNFDDPRLEPGLQQLVDGGLLNSDRLPELMAYEHPVQEVQ